MPYKFLLIRIKYRKISLLKGIFVIRNDIEAFAHSYSKYLKFNFKKREIFHYQHTLDAF